MGLQVSDEVKRGCTMPDVGAVEGWAAGLEALGWRIGSRFARAEPRERGVAYLKGLMSDIPRNGWQLAKHAGEATLDGMQRLLNTATRDVDGARDDVRAYAMAGLGTPPGPEEQIRGITQKARVEPGIEGEFGGVGSIRCLKMLDEAMSDLMRLMEVSDSE